MHKDPILKVQLC
jgi:WD40 repeat protein